MKLTPSPFLSFLLLLVWSSLGYAALIPPTFEDAFYEASHAKRGAVISKGQVYDTIPTVAQLVLQIKKDKIVAKRDSLFYSRLGGGSAQQIALQWHKDNVQTVNGRKTKARPGVTFDYVVNARWKTAQEDVISGIPDPKADMNQYQRRLSQAFAEVANGKVYFFTAAGLDGRNLPLFTTWAAFEYPALTRNPAVTEIIQVSMSGAHGVAQTIWERGDGPTSNAPVGNGPVPGVPSANSPTTTAPHGHRSTASVPHQGHATVKGSHGTQPTARPSHHPTASSPHRGRPTAKASRRPTASSPHRGRPTTKPFLQYRPTPRASQKARPTQRVKGSRL